MDAWYKSFQQTAPAVVSDKTTHHQPPKVASSKRSTPQPPMFTLEDFPPLPSVTSNSSAPTTPAHPRSPVPSSPSLVLGSVCSTASGVESSECTPGSDPVSIGNSSTTPQSRPEQSPLPTLTSVHPMITRARDGISKPNPRYCLLTQKASHSLPRTVSEALIHPGWNGSMHEEIDNCKETGTWSLVPVTPNMNVLGSRWVHRVKLNADAQVPSVKTEKHQTEKESGLGLAKLSREQKGKGKMYPEDDQAQCNEEPSKLESQRSSAVIKTKELQSKKIASSTVKQTAKEKVELKLFNPFSALDGFVAS
ncbi:hypothetical protein YC2023_080955 [Brassica napus]